MLKHECEDFVVEEIPAYEPCGEGEHLFLWIEKQDLSAEQLTQHLVRSLELRQGDIGIAGLKDRRAVTRQYVSVPVRAEARLSNVDTERIHVLRAARHRNKLRTGHLKGNRFDVLVRGVRDDALRRATRIADAVRRLGFPNYYGPQRFGHEGGTLILGRDLLAGDVNPRDIPPGRRRFLLRLALSAVQSALFNEIVVSRVRDGELHRVMRGDVMQVVASGGCFVVDDASLEQQRFDARETVLTGPLFGPRMIAPSGAAAEREETALARHGLTRAAFSNYSRLLPGARRAAVVWPEDLTVEKSADGIRFRFTLPPGAYATVLLDEFMKVAPTRAGTTSESD
jgi:tRNA pseudouridine13 synthase